MAVVMMQLNGTAIAHFNTVTVILEVFVLNTTWTLQCVLRIQTLTPDILVNLK